MRLIALSLLIAAASGAATPHRAVDRTADPAAKLVARLAGLQAGTPIECLPNGETRTAHTAAYGSTILYEVSRDRVYRTETNGGCEGLDRGDILVTKSNFGQLCRGDIAQTFEPIARFPTGSCSLGAFTPYRKP